MQLSNEGLLVILFVGLVAGWLAGKIVRGTGFGIIGDILVGIAGALIASFLFPKLGIHLGTGLVSEIPRSARSCCSLSCGWSEPAADSDADRVPSGCVSVSVGPLPFPKPASAEH